MFFSDSIGSCASTALPSAMWARGGRGDRGWGTDPAPGGREDNAPARRVGHLSAAEAGERERSGVRRGDSAEISEAIVRVDYG